MYCQNNRISRLTIAYIQHKLNKILDKKIIQEFKFLEKQGIMREVKGKIKHENSR